MVLIYIYYFSVSYFVIFCFKYRVFLNGFGYALFGVPSRDLESTWRHRTTSEMRNSPLLAMHSPVLSMITQNDGFPTDTISNHHLVPTTSSYPNEQPISITSTYNVIMHFNTLIYIL